MFESITHQIKNYQNLYETLRARRCDTTSGRLIRLKPSGSRDRKVFPKCYFSDFSPYFPGLQSVSMAQTAAPKLTIAGACCAAGITFATWEATDHHNSLSMDWFQGTRRFFYEIWVLQCSFQPILGFLWKKGRILIIWLEYRNTPDRNQVIV